MANIRIQLFCWSRHFSLRICNDSLGFENWYPTLYLTTLKKMKALSINKSRFLSVVQKFCRQVALIGDRKMKLVPQINFNNKFDMRRYVKIVKINMNSISVNVKKNFSSNRNFKKMYFNLFIVIYISNKYFGYYEVFNDFIADFATSWILNLFVGVWGHAPVINKILWRS